MWRKKVGITLKFPWIQLKIEDTFLSIYLINLGCFTHIENKAMMQFCNHYLPLWTIIWLTQTFFSQYLFVLKQEKIMLLGCFFFCFFFFHQTLCRISTTQEITIFSNSYTFIVSPSVPVDCLWLQIVRLSILFLDYLASSKLPL